MSKNSGNLYAPLETGDMGVMPGRSIDDPPPYTEVDSTMAPATTTKSPPPMGFMMESQQLVSRSRASTVPTPESSEAPVVVTRGVVLASKSIDVVCPHCKANIRTSIEKRPGLFAYLSGAVMACLCCFCGCCLIPCCVEQCMEVKHTCPNCDGFIGKFRH